MSEIIIECEETTCLICGADNPQKLIKLKDRLCGVPGVYQKVRCRECGHYYMNPRPKMESIKDCYPSDYGPYQPKEQATKAVPTVSEENLENNSSAKTPWYLSRWGRAIPGLRGFYYWLTESKSEIIPTRAEISCQGDIPQGLELGCSHGSFLDKLVSEGWKVHGVELSEQPAKIAREKGHDVFHGTLESTNFDDRQFDAVFAWMVIEHLINPRVEFAEIHRTLKPDGLFIFSIPNSGCWEPYFFGRYWFTYETPRHLNFFTTKTIRRLLTDTGFEPVEVIHQRNIFSVIASIGIVLREATPFYRTGSRLVQFTDNPSMWPQIFMAPIAIILAWFRQGGRITIVAKRKG